MPSQVVDDLWHEFILYTRNYELFCKQAFGRFLHHTPAIAMSLQNKKNDGLRQCWWAACFEENINPRKASRLPLLFAIDRKLNILDGFIYATDCRSPLLDPEKYAPGTRPIHCAADFARLADDSKGGRGLAGCSACSASGGSSRDGHGCNGGCSGGCGGGD